MKKVLFILLTFIGISALAQDPMLRKMSYTEFKAKAWLIPNSPNEFQVKKGVRFKFTINMTNEGKDEYPLLQKGAYIKCYYMVKAQEIPAPVKFEKLTQVQVVDAKMLSYRNRVNLVSKMNKDEANKYAKMFNIAGVETKDKLLQHLRTEQGKLGRNKKLALEFDQKKVVKPGVALTFTGSGFLPDGQEKKPPTAGQLMFKIYNSEGKHISIPVTAVFY